MLGEDDEPHMPSDLSARLLAADQSMRAKHVAQGRPAVRCAEGSRHGPALFAPKALLRGDDGRGWAAS